MIARLSTRLASTLIAALVLGACGSDKNDPAGPGNPADGQFEATVTGDVETDFGGAADFGSVDDPDYGEGVLIQLSEVGGSGLIQMVRIGSALPSPGTHPVADALNGTPADGDFVIIITDGPANNPDAIFVATGGTVSVEQSSSSELSGEFSFDATGVLTSDPETELTVSITGTFSAEPMAQGVMVPSIKSLKVEQSR